MDTLLEFINPIQMVERRVKTSEEKKEVTEQLIKDYGVLVEYYSVKDEGLADGYLGKMRQAIKQRYESEQAAGRIVVGK